MIRETADDDVASRLPIFYRGRTPTTAGRKPRHHTLHKRFLSNRSKTIRNQRRVSSSSRSCKSENPQQDSWTKSNSSFLRAPSLRQREEERKRNVTRQCLRVLCFLWPKKKKKKLGRKESDYLQWISSDRRETRVTQVDFNHTTIHFDDRASTGHVRISFEPTHLQLDRDPDRSDPYASGARGAATCAHGRLALGRSLGRLTRRWLSLLRGWPTGWMAGWFADCLPEQPFSLVARHSPCVAPPLRRMSKYRVEKVFDPRSSRHAVVGLRFLLRTEFDVSRRRREFSSVFRSAILSGDQRRFESRCLLQQDSGIFLFFLRVKKERSVDFIDILIIKGR